MGRKRLLPSFETPRKRAAPQDDGLNVWLGALICGRIDPCKMCACPSAKVGTMLFPQWNPRVPHALG
jgi:hypothetical protein